jgi:hypothetical protein
MHEVRFEFADLRTEQKTRMLGALLAHYDGELAAEVEGIAEIWAERREDADAGNDHGMQMMRDRTAADFRALAAAIDQHRRHLASL